MIAIEITTGINGYPSHLHRGYIGFLSYEEAESFAKRHQGQVVALRKRDGWQLWETRGTVFEPFSVDESVYGDDYRTVSSVEDWEDECRSLVAELINDGIGLDDLQKTLEGMLETKEEIAELEDGEAVLLYQGKYCDIIKTRTMSYHEDVWQNEVGVEIDGYDDEADSECE